MSPTITSLNKNARYAQWLDVYAERLPEGNYTALMIAHTPEGYVFDEEEAKRIENKRPLVLFDMREYGWDRSWKNEDILGGSEDEPEYSGEQWATLNKWMRNTAGHADLYFKREFNQQMQISTLGRIMGIQPIDLISRNRPWFEPQTKDEWMKRKGGIYSLLGHSHEDRILLHEALSSLPSQLGYDPIAKSEIIHHTNRRPLMQVIMEQMEFCLSLSPFGNGAKCFRDTEACVGCIPVITDAPIVRAIPYTSENSILMPFKDGRVDINGAMHAMLSALQDKESLWTIYLAAQEAARDYDPDTYCAKFIAPKIKEVLS